jgi:hypothetical protein
VGGDFDSKSRLAAAASPGEGHEPDGGIAQERDCLRYRLGAANQRTCWDGECRNREWLGTTDLRRASAGGGQERTPFLALQLERSDEQLERLAVGVGAGAALQVADTAAAQTRALGQRFLAQPRREAMRSQQVAEDWAVRETVGVDGFTLRHLQEPDARARSSSRPRTLGSSTASSTGKTRPSSQAAANAASPSAARTARVVWAWWKSFVSRP